MAVFTQPQPSINTALGDIKKQHPHISHSLPHLQTQVVVVQKSVVHTLADPITYGAISSGSRATAQR